MDCCETAEGPEIWPGTHRLGPGSAAIPLSSIALADEACRILDITRSTLSHWEAEGLVQPVYGKRVTPGAGFSLYQREDLAGLSRRRSRAA